MTCASAAADRRVGRRPRQGARLAPPSRAAPPAAGARAGGYWPADRRVPFTWAIFTWIHGRPYAVDDIDEVAAARDLAGYVLAMRGVEVRGSEPPGGRRPLAELDADTRHALARSRGLIDTDAALAAWDRALEAPVFRADTEPDARMWLHGDLLPPNILVRDGRLAAVLDFGSVGIGDPAADTIAAWTMFTERGRAAYREALGVDDGTWERARGYALTQAAMIVPYYAHTNPHFSAMARQTIAQVLADLDLP